jgi:hypothetical protein
MICSKVYNPETNAQIEGIEIRCNPHTVRIDDGILERFLRHLIFNFEMGTSKVATHRWDFAKEVRIDLRNR